MQISFLQKNMKKRGGFTLVETLVAVTVLLLVIIGPMTVAQKGIQNAYYANEQVTAVFLAQEAIEAVRELRDSDALEAYDDPTPGDDTWNWYGNLNSQCTNGTGCAYDVTTGNLETCVSNNSCRLRKDSNNTYNYEVGGVDSPFTRRVYVGSSVNDWVPVTVEVTWTSRIFDGSANNRSVKLQSWIYDHYQRYED